MSKQEHWYLVTCHHSFGLFSAEVTNHCPLEGVEAGRAIKSWKKSIEKSFDLENVGLVSFQYLGYYDKDEI